MLQLTCRQEILLKALLVPFRRQMTTRGARKPVPPPPLGPGKMAKRVGLSGLLDAMERRQGSTCKGTMHEGRYMRKRSPTQPGATVLTALKRKQIKCTTELPK